MMGFSQFPTAEYLQEHPQDAIEFTVWIWHRLLTTSKKCRGSDYTNCMRCSCSGYAEGAAMAALAKIVAVVNPTLSDSLMTRAKRLGYDPEQPDPYDPDKSSAVAMPIPKTPIKTDAVA